MGDLGLQGAYGAAGAADALRQLIKDRLIQQQVAFTQNRQTQEDARVAEEHAANMRDRRATAQSLADQRAAAQHQMEETDAARIAPTLSVNQSLPTQIAGRLRSTMQAANMTENPALAQPNVSGMMQPDIVPGQQPGAVWKGTDAQRSAEDDKQKMADVLSNPDTPPAVKQFLQLRGIMPKGENIPYQLITEPNGPPKAARQPVQVGPQGIYTDPEKAIGQPAYHAPQQTATVTIQTVDENGNKVTKVVPKKDAIGQTFAGAPSGQTERQTKAAGFALGDAQAVNDQIDAAEKAGLLGPSAGRINGQFLAGLVGSTGDPATDRRLGGLKAAIADLKTSYPMAISGTARGGGGGVDRLMSVLNSDKLSAELMRGAVDEIHGALTRRTGPQKTDGAPAKLTAEELIKKYGGD
jgi:hypothetical protein